MRSKTEGGEKTKDNLIKMGILEYSLEEFIDFI